MGDSAGTFTADASLTATFAATPTLEGMISGFTGQAVGSGWELKAGVAVADIRAPVRGTGADRR